MIIIDQDTFHITTKHTSYIIGIRAGIYLEHLYYGKRIRSIASKEPLCEKFATEYGNSVVSMHEQSLTLDNLCLEYSFGGVGDFRQLPIEMTMPDGSYSQRFYYTKYECYEGIYRDSNATKLPHGRDAVTKATGVKEEIKQCEQVDASIQTLELHLVDALYQVELHLIYTSFYDTDVISRRCVVRNLGQTSIQLHKLMSLQLDLPECNYRCNTYDGMWARERHRNQKDLRSGTYVNESTNGTSSNRHNSLLILEKQGCTQDTGECIGINLIYSGNHYEAVEVTGYNKLRIIAGINPHCFCWELPPGETFYTPEAILSYSNEGLDSLSHQFHSFVQRHIVAPQWANKERPILINNWEATYFDFTESKLCKLAKEAKKLGIELFVLDDGWFGQRSDDSSSLGDWVANEKKLGGTLQSFAEKIHRIGLQFGLWMEPEMISKQSNLFVEHPTWAVAIEERDCYVGRQQYLLDLTNPDVREYIITTITNLLESASIDYVKWDMNRAISDAYSRVLGKRQGEFYHRYVLGLYEVLDAITNRFPKILFESCSAGGNRFDLGMLYYMPQIWTSDNTDAHERINIQEGTSDGYPLHTMGAHVSAVPNHQTLRSISLETRFNVACFGVLGYELDLTQLTLAEKKIIQRQVEWYKQHRTLLQFGTLRKHQTQNGNIVWTVQNEQATEMMVLLYQPLQAPNTASDILKLVGLNDEALYTIHSRKQAISIKQFGSLVNQVSPISISEGGVLQSVIDKVYTLESEEEEYLAYGDLLQYAGIKLKQQFVATGYTNDTRVMGDFSSRLYYVQQVAENVEREES